MAGSSVLASKPMSVGEIVAKAQAFDFNPHIALKYWLRTADTLLSQAEIYEQEENDQQAYLLLMRYAMLVADKLSDHPQAGEPEGRKALRAAKKTIPGVVERLEALKPGIEARVQSWESAMELRRQKAALYGIKEDTRPRRSFDQAESDPAIAGRDTTLAAAEHGDLAVKLAHKELRRRQTARRATRQAGVSEEEEQERRTAGLWDDWEQALHKDPGATADADLRRRMEDTRRKIDVSETSTSDINQNRLSAATLGRTSARIEAPSTSQGGYRYPSISKSHALSSDSQLESRSSRQDVLPPRPSKEPLPGSVGGSVAPARPEKAPFPPAQLASEPASLATEEASTFTFRPSAYLENGSPLRTLFLPPTLREEFLVRAAKNTRANLETCGMLCGTLISNALFISRLVIPEQESTSDTCETVNESALFDYCDSEDLMVLGWIHTHPSQTCFMSSRDLHTHCGYQVMIPESIAIVCAPSKDPSWGVFRLTDPPGMKSVLNCRQSGLFHPHAEQNIYTGALRPGHVFEAKGLEFQVVDLRP